MTFVVASLLCLADDCMPASIEAPETWCEVYAERRMADLARGFLPGRAAVVQPGSVTCERMD